MKNSSNDFYAALAPGYDEMTRTRERSGSERQMLQRWLDRYPSTAVFDAACGTGLHAVLLAGLGVQVTAADPSAEMLAMAAHHAQETAVEITWLQSAMQTPLPGLRENFQLVLCLGNSLPHLLTEEDLLQSLRNFHDLLQPGGHLVIQLLNFEKILQAGERIISINRAGAREFIRFYDFTSPLLTFNVLEIDWAAAPPRHHLQSTALSPHRADHLSRALHEAHFANFHIWGDLKFAPYDVETSVNLVMAAEKPQRG